MPSIQKQLLAVAAGAFITGYLTHYSLVRLEVSRPQIDHHWAIVNRYLRQRDHGPLVKVNGLVGRTIEIDPDVSLSALVQVGELRHLDLVLPDVPATPETNRVWMDFVQRHPDFVECYGEVAGEFAPADGVIPIHLNLWYRPSADDKVRELVELLRTSAAKQRQP